MAGLLISAVTHADVRFSTMAPKRKQSGDGQRTLDFSKAGKKRRTDRCAKKHIRCLNATVTEGYPRV